MTTSRAYHIDRWLSSLGKANRSIEIVKPTANDVGHLHIITDEVHGTSGESFFMAQVLDRYEGQASQGQMFTLSLIYRTSCSTVFSLTYSSGEPGSAMKLPKSDDWNLATLSFTKKDGLIPRDHVRISAYITDVDDADEDKWIDLYAIKLEQSDHQTLAKQTDDGAWQLLDPPPNKATELLKCQRYQLVYQGGNFYKLLGMAFVRAKGRVDFELDLPTTLRANPTLRLTGSLRVRLGNVATAIADKGKINIGDVGGNTLLCWGDFTSSSATFTEGQAGVMYLNAEEGNQLIIDANL